MTVFNLQNDTSSTSQVQSAYIPSNNETEIINSENTSIDAESTSQTLSHTHSSAKIEDKQKLTDFGKSPVSKNRINNISQRSVGVQVIQKLVKPHFRSKSIMCKPSTTDASCQSQIEVANKMCSPIKSLLKTPTAAHCNSSSSAVASCLTNSSNEYQLSSHSEYKSSSCSEERKENDKKMKESALNITRYFVSIDAKKYIGIGNEWLWIIHLLHSSTKCNIDNIKLTLMKIRINDTFSRLGDQFGLSTSQASRVFNKTVKPLAHYLKTLVYCPNPSSIKKNLPVAFRAYYSHICAILDAFEIEIEKPSDPVQQALTWSEYKKCNTLKYLVACTPDGFIIFISSGYGGRISDTLLFEESKIMNILPEKCGIMADRGFKQIQTILNQKECELVRPPSVSTSTKSTKEEVLKTKSIASLRIHVERVIRRVREYKILEPHSCLDLNTMSYIDSIVTIVAGLINLQNPIIKK